MRDVGVVFVLLFIVLYWSSERHSLRVCPFVAHATACGPRQARIDRDTVAMCISFDNVHYPHIKKN